MAQRIVQPVSPDSWVNTLCTPLKHLFSEIVLIVIDDPVWRTKRPRPRAAARARRLHAGSLPDALATWVEIASISAGDSASYGSRPSSFSLALTAPMLAGSAPDSMMDETKAANSGGDQPSWSDSSVWIKSSP